MLAGATQASFGLAGAVLRGPGPLPRARSGARETLAGATQVLFVLAGAALRGPGPLPRARSAPTL